jgi:hypothetical protein
VERRDDAYPTKPWWRRGWRGWTNLAALLSLLVIVHPSTAFAQMGAQDAQDARSAQTGGRFTVQIPGQPPLNVDLAAGAPKSPYVMGVNVFPPTDTKAQDGAYGFMPYDDKTVQGLRSAGATLLRFPGGSWGEEHSFSFEQLNAFLALAQQLHATPLINVRLAGGDPEKAAALVRYCNDPHDPARKAYPDAPVVPVRYWAIGNEPDLRGTSYPVTQYVQDFIAYARAMKAADPTIQIYGPEVSQYKGPTTPHDASGTPWLSGFLQGVARYQQDHKETLLDGVSVHRYPFSDGDESTNLLYASASEWRYALPLLRAQIHEILGKDLPVAITEINTSPLGDAMISPPAAALWWADTLGTLIEQRAAMVAFFSARVVERPYPLLTMSGEATPLAQVMALYAHMASDAIPLGATGPISAFAATNSQHDTLTLLLVNTSSQSASITVDPAPGTSNWQPTRVQLPAYAVACLVLHAGQDGQRYQYAPTVSHPATGQADATQTGAIQETRLPQAPK